MNIIIIALLTAAIWLTLRALMVTNEKNKNENDNFNNLKNK